MAKDFHDKAFDEGTKVKLRLFENYIAEWLPVFLSSAKRKRINIVDFFAGPGRDVKGVEGSPLIALRQIYEFIPLIRQSCSSLHLLLNEKSTLKAAKLQRTLEDEKVGGGVCEWKVTAFVCPQARILAVSRAKGISGNVKRKRDSDVEPRR